MPKLQNSKWDKIPKQKLWQKQQSLIVTKKTLKKIMTKLKKLNCDKNKNQCCDHLKTAKIQKLKMWQNLKNQIAI